jgi:hypothetical protein
LEWIHEYLPKFLPNLNQNVYIYLISVLLFFKLSTNDFNFNENEKINYEFWISKLPLNENTIARLYFISKKLIPQDVTLDFIQKLVYKAALLQLEVI